MREDIPEIDSPGHNQRPTEGLWTAVSSTEDAEKLSRGGSLDEFSLASKVLIAALITFVLSFALQVYSSEKVDHATDSIMSGGLDEIQAAMDEAQDAADIARWAGYFQTIGLIVLAAGLVGIAVGLSKRLV